MTYYSLLVAKKGANLQLDYESLKPDVWICNVSNGVTENTEYTSVRLTLIKDQTPENITISVSTDEVTQGNITLGAKVIADESGMTE